MAEIWGQKAPQDPRTALIETSGKHKTSKDTSTVTKSSLKTRSQVRFEQIRELFENSLDRVRAYNPECATRPIS